jgi:O-antigen ligase
MGRLTPEMLVGVVIAVLFAGLCVVNLRRALFMYVLLGCLPFFGVLSLSGSNAEVEQGLLPVEVMATIMIAIWWLRERPKLKRPAITQKFERVLLLMIPISVVSILSGYLWPDPAVDRSHIKLMVSLGQVLLIVWPIGTYLVFANSINDSLWIRRFHQLVLLLAIPALALPFVSEKVQEYLVLTVYFGLAAAPFCFARIFYEQSPFKKVLLFAVSVAPLMYGVVIGKAFLYAYVMVSIGTVLFLRARTLVLGLIPLAVGAYFLVLAPGLANVVPEPVTDLLKVEEAQQSWGGKSGRVQLAIDAIGIWSHFPIMGVGAGNAWPYMHRYSAIDTPHNQYLNILLEFGLLGLTCYVAFVWRAFSMGLELRRRVRDPFHQMFVLGWLGSFAGMTVGSLTGDFMLPSIRNGGLELFSGFYLQWVLLGLVVSIKRMESKKVKLARAA